MRLGSVYNWLPKRKMRESSENFYEFEANSYSYLTRICGNLRRFYSFCSRQSNCKQTLGIDASNIRAGGGVTHLVELLRASDPLNYGFSKVIVWGNAKTLAQIADRPWLQKVYQPWLDRSLPWRILWQKFILPCLAKKQCDLLFAPGGNVSPKFHPVITMSQNLLPFEPVEIKRYGRFSWQRLRTNLLRYTQGSAFRLAEGVIFLSEYAKDIVVKQLEMKGKTVIIPHGIHDQFRLPTNARDFSKIFTQQYPCRILYVSSVDWYKHQWHVAEAVTLLRKKGLHVTLDLVGSAYPPALKKLQATIKQNDPEGKFLYYRGLIPHQTINTLYQEADIFVFASSCETFGQILTEAMASSLPIVCSDKSAMPEILQQDGLYCDPFDIQQMANRIECLYGDADLRQELATRAHQQAQKFAWQKTAEQTFQFFRGFVQGVENN